MNRKLYIALFVLVPLLTISSMAQAQFNRVFVAAKTGNDANSCNSVATPCQTFAGAVGQVNAGGEVIALESGGYGPVTINKAVNINAPAGIVAFIHPPSGDAITINAGASDTVILRGLTLNGGTGDGIFVSAVGQLFVEHCTITGYAGNGITFDSAGGSLFMRDDDVRGCVAAVQVAGGVTKARAVIRDSYFANNTGFGVLATNESLVSVINSVAAYNGYGFGAWPMFCPSCGADLTLDRVQAVSNNVGLAAANTGTLRLASSLVTQNTTGVSVVGGTGTVLGSSPGTSVVAGNGTDISGSFGIAMTLQ